MNVHKIQNESTQTNPHLGPRQCTLKGLLTTIFPEGTLNDHFRTDLTSPQQYIKNPIKQILFIP